MDLEKWTQNDFMDFVKEKLKKGKEKPLINKPSSASSNSNKVVKKNTIDKTKVTLVKTAKAIKIPIKSGLFLEKYSLSPSKIKGIPKTWTW